MSGTWRAIVEHPACLEIPLKIESVFKDAAQREYYKRANMVQRLPMEDAFYRLSMKLLTEIIGPFDL